MENLLVATDFSVRSDRATRRAALLARKLGAKLNLVHVIDNDLPARLLADERATASFLLEETVQTFGANDGIDADWQVIVDDPYVGILAAADDISADLIIIGPHRRRLRDVFVGTTAERVVRQSSRPLLVAVDTPSSDHHHTLLALDFDKASKSAARHALAMGVFDHTNVVVMHAFDAPAEHLLRRSFEPATSVAQYVEGERELAAAKLRDLLRDLGLPPTCQTVVSITGSPARTILESARGVGSDLIVVGTNKREGFERMLIGSVTADIIREAQRDLLIIPVDAET